MIENRGREAIGKDVSPHWGGGVRLIIKSSSATPDAKSELKLYQRDTEYSIRVNGRELMNSGRFGSEKMLAELSCAGIAQKENTCVLIGGLGMGYTLSAALASLDFLLCRVPDYVE